MDIQELTPEEGVREQATDAAQSPVKPEERTEETSQSDTQATATPPAEGAGTPGGQTAASATTDETGIPGTNGGNNGAPGTADNVTGTTDSTPGTPDVTATTDSTPDTTSATAPQKRVYATKKEVLDRIRELAHGDEPITREETDMLKTMFYKLHFAEREAQLKAFKDAGGEAENFIPVPDEDEDTYKAEMALIREKRARHAREQEEEREANLQRKLEIIEQIKGMLTSPEDANKSYQAFKALQQEWRERKNVPAAKASELWRNYQLYVEQFYDLLKLNSEAREYDFKKNLEVKTRLCEAAEKLAEEKDVVSAFHQLQKLHQEYRETGPVAKDLREDLWARFKAASTTVNKRHQQHFEELKAKEEDNLTKKTALCERVEAIAAEENKRSGDWEKHAKEIIAVQAEWKTIGFAPQKMNVKIFERFRAACDDFFTRKAEYYKAQKAVIKENADKKRALIAKANELKDSTDWKATTDKLIALQREWKTVGAVSKRLSDQLWSEFIGACNHFFEARNAATAGQREEEDANLQKKRDIIAQLNAIDENTPDAERAAQTLADDYYDTGHVPFREKNKMNDEFRAALDALHERLNITVARRKTYPFKSRTRAAGGGVDGIYGERARLMKQYDALRTEIQTYENNIGFLSASSKSGNALIDDMNRKVEKLKANMNVIKERIKTLDAQDKAQEQADEEDGAQ